MVRISNGTEFNNLLNALAWDITRAAIHWKLYSDIIDALSNDAIVFAQSQTFWQLTMEAHSHMAAHCLARVYDTHPAALHLSGWLETIQSNLHLFSEENFRERLASNPFVDGLAKSPRKPDADQLKADIAICSEQDAEVKLLANYRNFRDAHRNAGISKAGTGALNKHVLTDDVIETLVNRAKTILNRYSDLFMATTHSGTMVGHDDYRSIFQYVNEALDRREQEIASELLKADTIEAKT